MVSHFLKNSKLPVKMIKKNVRMNFLFREIIGTLLKKLGCNNRLVSQGRHASSCSTKRTNVTSQFQQPNFISRCNPIGRSTIFSHEIGQPTPATHPHKLMEGEIVPGIREEEFRTRRKSLMQSIKVHGSQGSQMKKSHLLVIPSSPKKYMTEKIPYIFRQNSDFLYLTGCLEPDSILVICSHGEDSEETSLFLRGKDAHSELWDGPRTGFDQAIDFFGVDKAMPLQDFESYISSFFKEHPDCLLWYDFTSDIHPSVHKTMRETLSHAWHKIWESPKPFIHRMRLYKSHAEQELMKKSCEIGSEAITETIRSSRPGDSEAQIFARVDFESRMKGAEYLAYPPVVAGGNRANIIHYINNDQIVREGDLVLMDAGCELHSYSSDITRTWPISGKFSPTQRILYEVVHSVQVELIELCSKFPTLDDLYSSMCRLLGRRLQEAGILSSKLDSKDLTRAAQVFCPHHVSHYLGMDVHDTSTVSRAIPLKPGMVLTVEPGLYVNANSKLANPEFLGNGIRIEDDILMTPSGPLVLTSSCPKHPDDIEKLMSGSK